jgi:hypothetical protein
MSARISNRQVFAVSAETYWRNLWLNPSFLHRLYTEQLGCRKIEVLEQSGDLASGMQRVLRLHKLVQAPAAVQKVLGSVMLLEEHSEFDAAAQRWSYRMIPERLADRMRVRGRFSIVPSPHGVEETTEDELEFQMFGVGSLVEAFMVRESKQSHALRIAFMQRYITENELR